MSLAVFAMVRSKLNLSLNLLSGSSASESNETLLSPSYIRTHTCREVCEYNPYRGCCINIWLKKVCSGSQFCEYLERDVLELSLLRPSIILGSECCDPCHQHQRQHTQNLPSPQKDEVVSNSSLEISRNEREISPTFMLYSVRSDAL